MDTISSKLAKFAVNLKFEDLPKPVVERVKEQILDELGVALGTSRLPWCKAVFQYVKNVNAPGKVTVLNYGFRTSVENAALANATFAHGFEMDDWHPPAPGHPGCVSVLAALALTEETNGSGKDFILGTAISDELIQRVAFACGTSLIHDRGIHASSAEGVFGAAGAASRLLKLSEAEATHAFGLAASHACGVMEFATSGGEVKRYHAGLGAQGGIRSALLAKVGLTAPSTAIEGKKGFLQAMSNKYDVNQFTDGLGKEFRTKEISFKTFAAPADMHPPIEGMVVLRDKYKLKAADIKDIELGLHKGGLWHLGSAGPHPKDASAAQFSVHYQLALTVIKGSNSFATLKQQWDEGFKDPEIIALAEKVNCVLDEETERIYPKVRQARVTVHTVDGRTLTHLQVSCKGMPDNPLTRDDFAAKFRGLASMVLPAKRVEEIVNTVWGLENLSNISKLVKLLVA